MEAFTTMRGSRRTRLICSRACHSESSRQACSRSLPGGNGRFQAQNCPSISLWTPILLTNFPLDASSARANITSRGKTAGISACAVSACTCCVHGCCVHGCCVHGEDHALKADSEEEFRSDSEACSGAMSAGHVAKDFLTSSGTSSDLISLSEKRRTAHGG
jgi:hypothetical protein